MSAFLRLLRQTFVHTSSSAAGGRRVISRQPEPPIGFVRRSDPSYYFLVRQRQG